MFRATSFTLPAFVFCLSLATPAFAQPTLSPPAGFESSIVFEFDASLPFQEQLGGLAFGPNGERIVYERGEIRSHPREGAPIILATFDPPVFGSFLQLAPDGESLYFGESSNHDIFRVPLDGGPRELVDNLVYNFDLEIAPEAAGAISGRGFISWTGSSGNSNSVWLLDDDPNTPNDEIIVDVSPNSGPICFDDAGNLFVVTSGRTDPTTGLPSEFLGRFSPEQLAEGIGEGTIPFSDSLEITDALDGFFNLEPFEGALWATNLGFASGVGSVTKVDPVTGDAEVFTSVHVAEAGFASASHLAINPGSKAFEVGNGRRSGEMLVAFGNFDDVSAIGEFYPEFHFVRGDVDGNEDIEVTDAIGILDWLFFGAENEDIHAPGDVNNDGKIDVADPVYLLNFAFRGGPQPEAPFPNRGPTE